MVNYYMYIVGKYKNKIETGLFRNECEYIIHLPT